MNSTDDIGDGLARFAYEIGRTPLEHAESTIETTIDAHLLVMSARIENPEAFPIYSADLSIKALACRVLGRLLDCGWKPPVIPVHSCAERPDDWPEDPSPRRPDRPQEAKNMTPYEFEDADSGGSKLIITQSAYHQAVSVRVVSAGGGDDVEVTLDGDQMPDVMRALYAGAGLPQPLTLPRVTPPLSGPYRPYDGGRLAADQFGKTVRISWDWEHGPSSSSSMTPAKAREMAAMLVALADAAEAEPTWKETDKLAGKLAREDGCSPETAQKLARSILLGGWKHPATGTGPS